MRKQKLNEERGAVRARKLKDRFSRISARSLPRRPILFNRSLGGDMPTAGRNVFPTRNALVVWIAIGLVALLIGSLVT